MRKNRLLPRDLPKLEEIHSLGEFIAEIPKYFPPLVVSPETLTIERFEKIAWNSYFNIATRILNASPQSWQQIITEYLLKFHIRNLKRIILGKIVEMEPDVIKSYLNWEIEDILDTKKMMDILLTQRSPRDILYTLRNSRFGSVLREGLTHYFNENDPLFFQIYLDRYYFTNLLTQEFHLPRHLLAVVYDHVNKEVEYHNVRTINRCLSNNFDRRIINELLVPSNFYLTPQNYSQLIASPSAEEMKKKYLAFFGKEKKYRYLRENPVLDNFTYYVREFYARLQLQPRALTEDMETGTLDEIFRILILLEYAIYHLVRTLIRIFHHAQIPGKQQFGDE